MHKGHLTCLFLMKGDSTCLVKISDDIIYIKISSYTRIRLCLLSEFLFLSFLKSPLIFWSSFFSKTPSPSSDLNASRKIFSLLSFLQNHRINKTFEMIQSNLWPNITLSVRPWQFFMSSVPFMTSPSSWIINLYALCQKKWIFIFSAIILTWRTNLFIGRWSLSLEGP